MDSKQESVAKVNKMSGIYRGKKWLALIEALWLEFKEAIKLIYMGQYGLCLPRQWGLLLWLEMWLALMRLM